MLDPHGVDVNDVDKKMFYLQTVFNGLNQMFFQANFAIISK
jgi:hypothetical protein